LKRLNTKYSFSCPNVLPGVGLDQIQKTGSAFGTNKGEGKAFGYFHMNDVGTDLVLYSTYRSFSGEFRYKNNMQLKSNEDFPVLQL